MQIGIIGCGRWGSLIAWYLHSLGHPVALYGRPGSKSLEQLKNTRKNGLLTLPEDIVLTDSLKTVLSADTLILSIPSQQLRAFLDTLRPYELHGKDIVLCMKGLEAETGRRLSEIAKEGLPPSNAVAVWLGPGHVQDFYAGIPNCMVIDSDNEQTKERLITAFSGPLIRFYYGTDLIGNEIGAAAKNVFGIAAGILDGLKLSSLKGALMSRGTREIARLIEAMGGNSQSAYGLCHLGDYEATLFSPHSHNRRYGESLVTGKPFEKLAEGHATARALHNLAARYGVELPVCEAVYRVLYQGADAGRAVSGLFDRALKEE